MRNRTMQFGATLLLNLLWIVTLHAQDRCDAILKGGVFDRYNVLDLHLRHKLVHDVTCNKSTNIDLGDATLSSDSFCNSKFEELIKIDKYVQSVERASEVIANAWASCMKYHQNGLIHYFETTETPRMFLYTIKFDFPGVQKAKIKKWTITPSSVACTGAIPGSKEAKTVDATGIHLTCVRDPFETVAITVDTDKGSAESITLPGVEDVYVLRMGPADDAGACFISDGGSQETRLADVNLSTPTKALYLTPQLQHNKTYKIRCEVTDLIVGSDFNGCWHGNYQIFKNGHTLVDWAPACCGNSSCGHPPRLAWQDSVSINVASEAVASDVEKALKLEKFLKDAADAIQKLAKP